MVESLRAGNIRPALSKEEKKRNRPSVYILIGIDGFCLTQTLHLPYVIPSIL
jgi:hypothetical protein